jgi:hypothetical protein
MNWKRFAVDMVGFSALMPFLNLYTYLEQQHGKHVAQITVILAFLPIAAIWHFYRKKYKRMSIPASVKTPELRGHKI